MLKLHANTIKVCDHCHILKHHQFDDNQYILTLASDVIAKETKPGQFVHVKVADNLSMRRPISIMSVDVKNATFDLFYKVVGKGTRQLSERKIGDALSIIGPIGNGFKLTNKKRPLLIGGGVGMSPLIAIAQQIKNKDYQPFAIFGSEVAFPFVKKLSDNGKNYAGATHTMPLLEDWGVECRLASLRDFKGVFTGFATDLARIFLDTLNTEDLTQIEIYTCGPRPMLKAVAELAKEYHLPCQMSLEEYMACGVGGCAGCVVKVHANAKVAMQRVCVDGPVFDAKQIF